MHIKPHHPPPSVFGERRMSPHGFSCLRWPYGNIDDAVGLERGQEDVEHPQQHQDDCTDVLHDCGTAQLCTHDKAANDQQRNGDCSARCEQDHAEPKAASRNLKVVLTLWKQSGNWWSHEGWCYILKHTVWLCWHDNLVLCSEMYSMLSGQQSHECSVVLHSEMYSMTMLA